MTVQTKFADRETMAGDRYLTANEIQASYRISASTFFRLLRLGHLPKGDLVGLKARRWRQSVVADAFAALSKGGAE